MLILLALEERRVQVEVGYGLEEWITDGFAGEVSRERMVAAFRAGNYGAGLLAGALQIAGRIAQGRNVTLEGVPVPRTRSSPSSDSALDHDHDLHRDHAAQPEPGRSGPKRARDYRRGLVERRGPVRRRLGWRRLRRRRLRRRVRRRWVRRRLRRVRRRPLGRRRRRRQLVIGTIRKASVVALGALAAATREESSHENDTQNGSQHHGAGAGRRCR